MPSHPQIASVRSLWYAVLISVMFTQCVSAVASESALSFFESADGIKAGSAILAVLAFLVGAVICLAGYKFFRYTIFVCGFIIGGIIVASVIEAIFTNKSYVNTVSWIGFFVGGITLGLLAMAMYSLSIFIAGATGGVLLAFMLHTSATYKLSASSPNIILLIIAVLFGIIGGITALKFEKVMIIVSTSFVGAVAAMWGIGYFAGDFPNTFNLGDATPDAWWVYLFCIVVLTGCGIFVQVRKTSHGHDHRSHHKHHSLTSAAIPASSPYVTAATPPAQMNQIGSPV